MKSVEGVMVNETNSNVTEKMVKIHMIVVVGVCAAFTILNIATGYYIPGILTLVLGGVAAGICQLSKDKLDRPTRGSVLAIAQLAIIIVMSSWKSELHSMFPLMLASMAIAAIYFSKKCLVIHWVIMDIPSVLGLVLNDLFYGGQSIDFLLKGIIGINVGAALIMYLVNCALKFIGTAQTAKAEADSLLEQVNSQMDASKEVAEQQRKVVMDIAEISSEVNSSAGEMRRVAESISAAAEQQRSTIEEVSERITTVAEQTEACLDESVMAYKAAQNSKQLIEESNAEIKHMSDSMQEIEQSSSQIGNIVNAIEDIAFQTNILALNASIEAARAGEAGKGFAVVAEEVRNLAGKSQESVRNTAGLINAAINAVQRGKEISDNIAAKMSEVMTAAETSAYHSDKISDMNRKQVEAIESVQQYMEQISSAVADTAQTSVQSTEIAAHVLNNSQKMDEIVKDFRG
jgi:methyl-accepting chemotaxis protein